MLKGRLYERSRQKFAIGDHFVLWAQHERKVSETEFSSYNYRLLLRTPFSARLYWEQFSRNSRGIRDLRYIGSTFHISILRQLRKCFRVQSHRFRWYEVNKIFFLKKKHRSYREINVRILSGIKKLRYLTFPKTMSDLLGVKESVIFTGWPGFSTGHGVISYFKVLSGGPVKVREDYPVNKTPVNYKWSEILSIEQLLMITKRYRILHGSAMCQLQLHCWWNNK